MKKLFSRNRRNLLADEGDVQPGNKNRNYLKYARGEIILVVIGILIALQINNWNESRKQSLNAQVYYHQLIDDLNDDKEYARFIINKFQSQREAYNNYLEKFDTTNYTRKEMYDDLLALNSESYAINFTLSTLESLQNSGEIVLIPPVLRNKLLDLKRKQQKITTDESLDNQAKTAVTEHLSLLIGAYDLQDRLKNQPALKNALQIDRNTNDIILALEGIQAWMNFSEVKSIRLLNDLLDEIDEIEGLIEQQIKD